MAPVFLKGNFYEESRIYGMVYGSPLFRQEYVGCFTLPMSYYKEVVLLKFLMEMKFEHGSLRIWAFRKKAEMKISGEFRTSQNLSRVLVVLH